MTKGRLEAFSDGVLAIIITIMVLELKVPHGDSFWDLSPLASRALSYALSYVYLGIYWNNHHHLMQAVQGVGGGVLWANLHLLFWLSLVPFTTAWMGETDFSQSPVLLYTLNLFLAALAFYILTLSLRKVHDKNSSLAKALGRDRKGKISLLLYLLALAIGFYRPALAHGINWIVALIWLVPDKRFEKILKN